jgi:nanoRNase/pAp phosphatase (c-di-AMP/oligoRNAs hydrolase)
MIHDQLNNIIGARVREVLQYHLQGTPEEFDAATGAVLEELSFMGNNLQSLVSFTGVDVNTIEGKTELADRLVRLLKEGN